MEAIKTSQKVEFEVLYADGTRRRVREGVLFEVKNEQIVCHNGTSRARVWFAVAESVLAIIEDAGLLKLFDAYIRIDPNDCATLETVDKLSHHQQDAASAEMQAVFRLGQMDMRESIVSMLTEAADVPLESPRPH